MERRIMTIIDIEKRLQNVWFTNMWGDRFPARDSYVMLAIEKGVFSYDLFNGYDEHNGKRISGSSARICIDIGRTERNPHVYVLSFFRYGEGNGEHITGAVIDARNIRLSEEQNQNLITLRIGCSEGTSFLSYSKDSIIYEDDWRKCEKCGKEARLGDDLWNFISRGRCGLFNGPAKCPYCGHPSEFY